MDNEEINSIDQSFINLLVDFAKYSYKKGTISEKEMNTLISIDAKAYIFKPLKTIN